MNEYKINTSPAFTIKIYAIIKMFPERIYNFKDR